MAKRLRTRRNTTKKTKRTRRKVSRKSYLKQNRRKRTNKRRSTTKRGGSSLGYAAPAGAARDLSFVISGAEKSGEKQPLSTGSTLYWFCSDSSAEAWLGNISSSFSTIKNESVVPAREVETSECRVGFYCLIGSEVHYFPKEGAVVSAMGAWIRYDWYLKIKYPEASCCTWKFRIAPGAGGRGRFVTAKLMADMKTS